jgi:hypothetical protein
MPVINALYRNTTEALLMNEDEFIEWLEDAIPRAKQNVIRLGESPSNIWWRLEEQFWFLLKKYGVDYLVLCLRKKSVGIFKYDMTNKFEAVVREVYGDVEKIAFSEKGRGRR